MKFTTSAVIALSSAAFAHATVFEDAIKFATQLADAALTPNSGSYMLQNVGTGEYLGFTHDNGTPDVTLSKEKGAPIRLKHFGLKEGLDAYAIALGGEDDPEHYCLSSQWNYDLGVDKYDTLYKCCPNDRDTCDHGNEEDGPLRLAKQSHFLVPSKSVAIRVTSKAVQALRRRAARGHDRMTKRAKVSKKFVGGEVVHIVAVDHKDDMAQRALVGKIVTSAGNYKSLALEPVDVDDDNQKWRVIKG